MKASFESIIKRLGNAKKRGVVFRENQTLEDLYQERTALFEKYADVTVCEDGAGLEETFELVLDTLKNGKYVTV